MQELEEQFLAESKAAREAWNRQHEEIKSGPKHGSFSGKKIIILISYGAIMFVLPDDNGDRVKK